MPGLYDGGGGERTTTVAFLLMAFQADYSICTHLRIMECARRQLKSVTGFQHHLLTQLRQTKCDASLHNVNDLVVPM